MRGSSNRTETETDTGERAEGRAARKRGNMLQKWDRLAVQALPEKTMCREHISGGHGEVPHRSGCWVPCRCSHSGPPVKSVVTRRIRGSAIRVMIVGIGMNELRRQRLITDMDLIDAGGRGWTGVIWRQTAFAQSSVGDWTESPLTGDALVCGRGWRVRIRGRRSPWRCWRTACRSWSLLAI